MLIADKFCDVCEIQIMDKGEEKFFKKFSLQYLLQSLTDKMLYYINLVITKDWQ